jgi:hypothetical protein
MEYIVITIVIILFIRFCIKNKHIFFIEDNPKVENRLTTTESVDQTFSQILNNFKLRSSLMNSNERTFFEQLKVAVGGQYSIYPQVSLSAIFEPNKHWNNWGELSRLNKKIDFVLFDKNTQTPKIAIELDGYSHSNPKSFDRDKFISQIFSKFNIPLVRFNNGHYSASEIKNKLSIF